MSRRLLHQLVRYAAAAAVGSALLAGTSGAGPAPGPRTSRSDVVSSAHPTPTAPTVHEETVRTAWVLGSRSRANAVATTSAICDGCRGTAVSVQVVEVIRGRQVEADNVATAWARCRDCTVDAVSVQVVLLHRPAALTTNNRALAVTGDCQRCSARSAAYQVVMDATGHSPDLRRLREEVAAWATRRPGAADTRPRLRSDTSAPASQRRLAGLERRVTALVDGAVLSSGAAVRRD